jgi:mannosylglycerate hydrolase
VDAGGRTRRHPGYGRRRRRRGLVTVVVDPTDGTFSLDGTPGFGRLVDGGDVGDTYNWCPPATDTIVEEPDGVEVAMLERGPVRARVLVVARYRWPERREGLDRRTGDVAHEVFTTLELRAGERAVRVEVVVENHSRDHRLRVHLPLPSPAVASRAECAFGVVERGLTAEGGPTEAPLATYPAQRFVQAGGLTVVHDGVTEYELVDVRGGAAHELALTLLRATGMLSQVPMPTRPLPAGPLVPAGDAQLQTRVTRRYSVAVGDDVDPFALADEVLVPLRVGGLDARGRGPVARVAATRVPADLPASGSGLDVTGAVVSSVVRRGEGLVVRVFNPAGTATVVNVPGRRGWLVDLRGRPLEPFEGSFPLRAGGIATMALSPEPAPSG